MARILNTFAAALTVAYLAFPPAATSQCAFEHPKRAKKFQASLVQAFVDCNSFSNTTTEGGLPACEPPETFNELLGDPSNGWRWDELRGQGQISLKATSTAPPSLLNPPVNSADIAAQLKLTGIIDANGPASGNGTLAFLLRITMNDRQSGDTTIVDFPVGITFPMTAGKANVKTSIDAHLNAMQQPGLPTCSSVEILSTQVIDPNGMAFGNTGLFLP